MRSTLFLLVLSFGTILNCQAQSWAELSTGITTPLRDVFFITEGKGWAVGDQGVILTTTNGGDSWTPQVSGITTATFRSVFFTSENNGWAVGSYNTLRSTTDGGTTWNTVSSGSSTQEFKDVFFASPTTGYIVGSNGSAGFVKRTTDGGANWATTSITGSPLESVHFTSDNEGWACGRLGVIYHTSNGVDWTQQVAPGPNITYNFNTIFMLSDTEGWACGDPYNIKHTVDGGTTWTGEASGTYAGKTGLYFSSDGSGWATTTSSLGGGQPIRHTSDGTTWTELPLTLPTVHNLFFFHDTLGWTVGDNGSMVRYGTPSVTSGIMAEPERTAIRVYPNPVADLLMIASSRPIVSATVTDATGQLALFRNGPLSTLDVSRLAPGSYALSLSLLNGALPHVERFVKE